MNKIITVTREFGSGGRELAKRLAEKLGYRYYDKQILSSFAQLLGFDKDYVDRVDTLGTDALSYVTGKSFSFYSASQKMATTLLVLEQKIIKELATKGNCVFVGMASDLILRDFNTLNVFVYADMNSKVNRCKEKAECGEVESDKELIKKIKKIDKSRKKHNLLLGSDEWGKKENYDLCINTSGLEIKGLLPTVESFANEFFKERE